MAAKLDYTFAADALAVKAGVPSALVSALVNAESAWNPNAVSSTGATGLGQFTRGTGTDYGLVGDTFDNRTDAALNLTAMVKYLADLRRSNASWREVIGHYSGQGTELAGYARYSAGQALLATIAMVDGTAVPAGEGEPAPVHLQISGQQGGKPVPIVLGSVAALMLLVAGAGAMLGCSAPPQIQQIAASPPPRPGFDWSGTTFYFASDDQGRLHTVPIAGK